MAGRAADEERIGRDLLREGAAAIGLAPDERVVEKLWGYATAVAAWNERVNLTGARSAAEVVREHIMDSLACVTVVPLANGGRLVDVGSGAGFPGMVLRLCVPGLEVVLIDSSRKRCAFLRHVVRELGCAGAQVLEGRAEEFGRDGRYRERFDVATCRAVDRLSVVAEYCLPFVRVGGVFVALKGGRVGEELAAGTRAAEMLGGGRGVVVEREMPFGRGVRRFVVFEKVGPCPGEYPRRVGVPRKRPLG